MDITTEFGGLGAKLVSDTEADVKKNLSDIVGLLTVQLQSETGGDPQALKVRTDAILESLRSGNGIGINTAAPAPATAAALGTASSTDTSEEARLGHILLHDILGGDRTAGDPALDMLREMAASKETAVFAAHVIKGLPSDVFTKVNPNVAGDFVIATVRDVAAGNDEILPSGMGYELRSVKEQRRVNNVLTGERDNLLHDLGINKVADAPAAVKSLRDEKAARAGLENLLTTRSRISPNTGETSLVFADRALNAIEGNALTNSLDVLGSKVGVTRIPGEDNTAYQTRLVKHLGTLHAAHVRLVNIAGNNGVAKDDGTAFTLTDNPNDLIEALIAFQAGRVGGLGGPRLHA